MQAPLATFAHPQGEQLAQAGTLALVHECSAPLALLHVCSASALQQRLRVCSASTPRLLSSGGSVSTPCPLHVLSMSALQQRLRVHSASALGLLWVRSSSAIQQRLHVHSPAEPPRSEEAFADASGNVHLPLVAGNMHGLAEAHFLFFLTVPIRAECPTIFHFWPLLHVDRHFP